MELSLFDRQRRKRMTVYLLVWLLAIAVFYAAVCTPLSSLVSSDVLLADSLLPLLLDAILLICNYLFYWIAFAVVLYALLRYGLNNAKPMLAVYAAVVVFRYFANQTVDFCVFGFPTINTFCSLYLPYCLVDIVLDLAQMGIVVWVVLVQKKGASAPDKLLDAELPAAKPWDWKKRSLRTAFLVALVPAAVRFVSRMIFDVWYGAPRGLSDLLWMIAAYLFDVVCLWIGYFFLVLLINRFFLRDKRAKLEN